MSFLNDITLTELLLDLFVALETPMFAVGLFSDTDQTGMGIAMIVIPKRLASFPAGCTGTISGPILYQFNSCSSVRDKQEIKVLWIGIEESQRSLADKVHPVTGKCRRR